MAYNDLITRLNAQPLIPEDVQREIVANIPKASGFLSAATRLPNMSRKQRRIPVTDSLVEVNFVNGDSGVKETTSQQWRNVFIEAEELAAIVVIPEAVIADADYDIWGNLKPDIIEAIGRKVDKAAFFGTNAPSTWPAGLLALASAAGNVVSAASFVDLYAAILGVNGSLSKVEDDGYEVSGHVAAVKLKAALRDTRSADGQGLFMTSPIHGNTDMQNSARYQIDGNDIFFVRNGGFDAAQALMFSGDWTQVKYAIRQDVTFKMFDQGVVQDGAGDITHNLMQQDGVAMRVVVRLGWAVPNPINAMQPTTANRFPISVLTP